MEKRKLLNKHLNSFNRRWLAYMLRESYYWMMTYESDACICEEKGTSDGLIAFGYENGTLSKRERDRYKKAFWNLYRYKRGWNV